jgi:PPOX class probable F420-dependent enzyme
MTTAEATTILTTDSVAQALLGSTALARLAYIWPDGKPRVVPMWFHWNDRAVIMATAANAPKMRALTANPDVALSIDVDAWPYQMLTIRGTASVDLVDEMPPEFPIMARRYLGIGMAEQFVPVAGEKVRRWIRIAVRPEEVRILDFQTRFPSAWSTDEDRS